jgi:UPF0755 protein
LQVLKPFLTILSALVIFSLLFVGCWLMYIFFAVSGNSAPVEIRVEQGEPFATVVRKLRAYHVITNERLFSLWARISGSDKKIQWGLYRFDPSLSPREVLDRMVLGKGVFYSVTIPEGLTVKEIADLLANMQIADREKFLAEAANPELLATLGLQDKGIEGYLFPSTYHFTPLMSERDIILAMVEQFRKVSEPVWTRYQATAQFTFHEIVTLASMIEKETGVEAERPLISAVFYNRLRLHMPLQSDPTVIYGLKEYNGDLTRKDLKDESPYNTYRIPGLPPGPICNPGLSSLKAALQPASVSYLYFVSKNDGTHAFSENLEAHNQAVKEYQVGHEVRHPPDNHRALMHHQ